VKGSATLKGSTGPTKRQFVIALARSVTRVAWCRQRIARRKGLRRHTCHVSSFVFKCNASRTVASELGASSITSQRSSLGGPSHHRSVLIPMLIVAPSQQPLSSQSNMALRSVFPHAPITRVSLGFLKELAEYDTVIGLPRHLRNVAYTKHIFVGTSKGPARERFDPTDNLRCLTDRLVQALRGSVPHHRAFRGCGV
jgi:hypothetical protein